MKVNSIQYLRAAAALLVVYCHSIDTQINFGISFQQNFFFLQNFGAIGVDIFFIISGFIISLVSSNYFGAKSTGKFLAKRFLRINPSYYLVSALALSLRYISKSNLEFPSAEVIKTITILPIVDTGVVFWKPILYVGWTLAFEWLFYIIFSILILVSAKNKDIILIGIFILFSLVGVLFPIKSIQYIFVTNPIALEFCIGVLLAFIYKTLEPSKSLAKASFILGLVSLGLLIFIGYGNVSEATSTLNGENSWSRLLIWGMPSAALIFGLIFLEKHHVLKFENKTILLIGDASFAIYLIHPICFSLCAYILKKVPMIVRFLPLDVLVLIMFCFASILGVLYYKFIEKRITRILNRIFNT